MIFLNTNDTQLQIFLQRSDIEESPAWELLNGVVTQKVMPTFYHSRLQKKLIAAIDTAGSIYEAFPELRCILTQSSIVPDIAIIDQSRLPDGNQPVQGSPDWTIEILSPGQNTLKMLVKLELCLNEGTKLGWIIDPNDQMVLVLWPDRASKIVQGSMPLPVLPDINLVLTPADLFKWLPQIQQ